MLSGLPTVHVLGARNGSAHGLTMGINAAGLGRVGFGCRPPDTQSILRPRSRPHGKHEHHVGRNPEDRLDHRSGRWISMAMSASVSFVPPKKFADNFSAMGRKRSGGSFLVLLSGRDNVGL